MPSKKNNKVSILGLRIKEKTIWRFSITCTVVSACTLIGFIIYSGLFTPEKSFAAVAKYYSIDNGEWSTFIWSDVSNTSPSCSCKPSCNLSSNAQIRHIVTVTNTSCGTFAVSGGHTMDINNGGNLTISVPFTLSGGSIINVAAGDTLIVHGNTTLSGGSSINVYGYLIIDGNLNMSGGSTICGSGQGYVINGTISGSGWCFTGTLPVQLSSFTATEESNGSIKFNWVTETEINNDYFTIESSIDGEKFESIVNVKGAGNSTKRKYYSWTYENPKQETEFFRLKQTDYDGKETWSNIIQVKTSSPEKEISIYPNPLFNTSPLYIKTPNDKKLYSIRIFNLSGILIFQRILNEDSCANTFLLDINTAEISSGIYFYIIYANKEKAKQGKLLIE